MSDFKFSIEAIKVNKIYNKKDKKIDALNNFNININSIAVKDKVIEVNTKLSLSDPNKNEKKSYFEIIFATVIKIDDDLKEKKEIEKIILCDLQNKIYSDIEKTFFKLVVNSGYPEPKPNKKIDFNELYNSRQN